MDFDYYHHAGHLHGHPGGLASVYGRSISTSSNGSTGSPAKMASDNSFSTDDSRASSDSSSPDLGRLAAAGEDNNVLIDVVNVDKCDEKLIYTDDDVYQTRPYPDRVGGGGGGQWPEQDTGRTREEDTGSGGGYLLEPERVAGGDYRGRIMFAQPPAAIEDDELCSFSPEHLIRMQVDDTPLDLSIHHR